MSFPGMVSFSRAIEEKVCQSLAKYRHVLQKLYETMLPFAEVHAQAILSCRLH